MPSVGHLAYNYFGGNIGGPIKKNKMFIFGDYLRVMDHEANTNLVTIPPSRWRTGDLSAGDLADRLVYDPATGNPPTAPAGRRSPATSFPPTASTRIARRFWRLLPAPNQSFK